VFGRAFGEAYKQAAASSKYAREAAASGNPTTPGARPGASGGLSLDEAYKILDIGPPKSGPGGVDPDAFAKRVSERFKVLFDKNEPKTGGSFYLQSKVLRARERLDVEIRNMEQAAESAAQNKGWTPKVRMYKN